ncbi:Alpha/beta hydrolase family protein [compost metagenome]
MLSTITVPTALVVGRQDAWSPLAQHELMQTRIPQSQLYVIEDAGHFAPVERPEPVAAALDAWMKTQ